MQLNTKRMHADLRAVVQERERTTEDELREDIEELEKLCAAQQAAIVFLSDTVILLKGNVTRLWAEVSAKSPANA
jgi:hypothetical protein